MPTLDTINHRSKGLEDQTILQIFIDVVSKTSKFLDADLLLTEKSSAEWVELVYQVTLECIAKSNLQHDWMIIEKLLAFWAGLVDHASKSLKAELSGEIRAKVSKVVF